MTSSSFAAIAPIIILSLTTVVLMVQASIKRDQSVAWVITALGLVSSLFGTVVAYDYAQPVTILLLADSWGLFLTGLIIVSSLITLVLSRDTFSKEGERKEEYYLLLVLAVLGAVVLVQSRHMISLLLGMELMGISLYAMVAFPERGKLPLEAAIKYLVLSACASVILLYGFALIYAATGELGFSEIGESGVVAFANNPMLIMAGGAMVLSGIAFKLSLAPFHMWTPDVYQGAPTPVTGFLATVSKGAVFVVLTRFYIDGRLFQYETLNNALVLLAILSMLVGNWLALRQDNIKRLLAYSSIAHFGYLLIVLAALSRLDTNFVYQAVTFYLAAYMTTTLAAFAVVSTVAGENNDLHNIKAFEGLFWRRPLEASLMTVAMLSLAGIPLTAGFMGKFFVISVGIKANLWVLLSVLVVGSAVSIYYYLRIVFAMSKSTVLSNESPGIMEKCLMVFLLLVVLALGSWPQPFIGFVSQLQG